MWSGWCLVLDVLSSELSGRCQSPLHFLFTSSSVQLDSLFTVGRTLWVSFLLFKQGSFPHFAWSEERRNAIACIVLFTIWNKEGFGGKIYGVMLLMCGWWLSIAYEVYSVLLVFAFCWLIVGLEGELPPGGVRDYSSLIYSLTVCLFQISWSCMYFKFNCMLYNCLFPATPMF